MKIIIEKVYRVRFNWQSLDEHAKLNKYLKKFVMDGNEYMEISNGGGPDMKGGTRGTKVIEVFEEGIPHIQKFIDVLS